MRSIVCMISGFISGILLKLSLGGEPHEYSYLVLSTLLFYATIWYGSGRPMSEITLDKFTSIVTIASVTICSALVLLL